MELYTYNGYIQIIRFILENRPNLKSMLRHEELESKERASTVMNKIMASGNQNLKVCFTHFQVHFCY